MNAYSEDAYIVADVGGVCGDWEAIIYRSGYVNVTESDCDTSKVTYRLYQLGKDDLKKIDRALFEASFKSLPDNIEPQTYVTDEAVFFIRVKTPLGMKVVTAEGLDRPKDTDLVRRFQLVWDCVKSLVPNDE